MIEEWGPTNGERLVAQLAANERAERIKSAILMVCAVVVTIAAVKYIFL